MSILDNVLPSGNEGPCDHPECVAFRASAAVVDEFIRDRADEARMLDELSILFGSGPRVVLDVTDETGDIAVMRVAPAELEAGDVAEKFAIIQTSVSGAVLTRAQVVELYDSLGAVLAAS